MLFKLSRRQMVLSGVALAALGACATKPTAGPDAIVGSGGFASVKAALDAAPDNALTPYIIQIRDGVWHEKLIIDKPNIHLIGESRDGTILDYDDAAGYLNADGERIGTTRSASLTIIAPGCALKNLTLRNSFDYNHARSTPDHPAGNGLQAVALTIRGEADRTLIEEVTLESWQDTLFVNAGRSLFRNCRIEGSVDYIFGAGTAYFEACEILTRNRTSFSGGREGYVTAPSTDIDNPYGLVFADCRLTKTPDLRAGTIALGRPWHNARNAVGQAVFLRCWMDDHIDADAWDRMAYGRNEDGSYKFFKPEDARFLEYGSTGPGANRDTTAHQLSAEDADALTLDKVLGDWSV